MAMAGVGSGTATESEFGQHRKRNALMVGGNAELLGTAKAQASSLKDPPFLLPRPPLPAYPFRQEYTLDAFEARGSSRDSQ